MRASSGHRCMRPMWPVAAPYGYHLNFQNTCTAAAIWSIKTIAWHNDSCNNAKFDMYCMCFTSD